MRTKILLTSLVLWSCIVSASGPVHEYKRSDFGSGWIDADGDCQNTRHETLIEQAIFVVVAECTVTHGFWVDPYTGEGFTRPFDLDIDHVVPLDEAWRSGASKWTRSRRIEFANDIENLLVVSSSANRSKGARDPAQWMPSNLSYWEEYLSRWIAVKSKYGLEIDKDEAIAIRRLGKLADDYRIRFKITPKNIELLERLDK